MAAGLCLAAPRAAADCTSHAPSLAYPPPPFESHRDAPRQPKSPPAQTPCHGPNCRQAPADPAPPPAPPRSTAGENWAWVQARPAPAAADGAAWAAGRAPLGPLFSPSPIERPPR